MALAMACGVGVKVQIKSVILVREGMKGYLMIFNTRTFVHYEKPWEMLLNPLISAFVQWAVDVEYHCNPIEVNGMLQGFEKYFGTGNDSHMK